MTHVGQRAKFSWNHTGEDVVMQVAAKCHNFTIIRRKKVREMKAESCRKKEKRTAHKKFRGVTAPSSVGIVPAM